jgi:hypothetical protein
MQHLQSHLARYESLSHDANSSNNMSSDEFSDCPHDEKFMENDQNEEEYTKEWDSPPIFDSDSNDDNEEVISLLSSQEIVQNLDACI